MQDLLELRRNPSPRYTAAPLETDLFEWHFTICGPPETPFEGGVYHGRIIFPADFPHAPPSIIFLTPSGRFMTDTKICLSISAYHPESWSPIWSIRHIMEALISMLPTPGEGAIGAMESADEDRRRFAEQSRSWSCPHCGKAADLLPQLAGDELALAERRDAAEQERMQADPSMRLQFGAAPSKDKGGEEDADDVADDGDKWDEGETRERPASDVRRRMVTGVEVRVETRTASSAASAPSPRTSGTSVPSRDTSDTTCSTAAPSPRTTATSAPRPDTDATSAPPPRPVAAAGPVRDERAAAGVLEAPGAVVLGAAGQRDETDRWLDAIAVILTILLAIALWRRVYGADAE